MALDWRSWAVLLCGQASAAQQAIEVPALPLFGLLVTQEASLLDAKFRRTHIPTPMQILTWDELMQHLVEDDVFDHVARHKRLVQEAMDADQLVALLVRTKTYRGPLALWRTATPGNVRLHAIDEITLVQVLVNGVKIKIMPTRLQERRTW